MNLQDLIKKYQDILEDESLLHNLKTSDLKSTKSAEKLFLITQENFDISLAKHMQGMIKVFLNSFITELKQLETDFQHYFNTELINHWDRENQKLKSEINQLKQKQITKKDFNEVLWDDLVPIKETDETSKGLKINRTWILSKYNIEKNEYDLENMVYAIISKEKYEMLDDE